MAVIAGGGIRMSWASEHRTGVCEDCGHNVMVMVAVEGKQRPRCAKCRGLGQLIVRHVSIQPAAPPVCLSVPCLWKFFRDSLFIALVANYHRRRVAYAEANRHKVILERYRTGEPSPQTIWQAIHANTKLTCPICRKFNVDPLLFNKK